MFYNQCKKARRKQQDGCLLLSEHKTLFKVTFLVILCGKANPWHINSYKITLFWFIVFYYLFFFFKKKFNNNVPFPLRHVFTLDSSNICEPLSFVCLFWFIVFYYLFLCHVFTLDSSNICEPLSFVWSGVSDSFFYNFFFKNIFYKLI